MSCTNPRAAILIPADNQAGRKIKFLSRVDSNQSYPELKAKYGDWFVQIPCGKCDSCIEQRTKSWAIRCCLEAQQYKDNCFITLTYNPSSLPKDGLCRSDIKRFIKNLRNEFGPGIRYYGCGEYGTNYDRPHYHIILFNFFPPDAEIVTAGPFGGFYYKSKSLQALWRSKSKDANGNYHSLGFVSVGDLSFNSCAYVARYCNKKIKDMGIVRKNPEFSFMSRKPGIGEVYFREHFKSLIDTDRIYASIEGKNNFSSFRYFDKLIEKIDPSVLQDLKEKRISNSEVSVASELLRHNLPAMEAYLTHQERLTAEKYDRLRRRLV